MKLVKEFFVYKCCYFIQLTCSKIGLKLNLKVFNTEWFQTQKEFTTHFE